MRTDFRYHLKHRHWGGLVRSMFNTIVLLHEGELCQRCGRQYVTWHAMQPLWERCRDRASGLFCPACFQKLARENGVRVLFVAEPWIVDGVEDVEIRERVWEGFRYYGPGYDEYGVWVGNVATA